MTLESRGLVPGSLGRWQRGWGTDTDSPAHALQGLGEDLWGHAMLVLQDQALFQRH